MPSCCEGEGYEAVFTDHFSQRVAKRYRRSGLSATSQRMVDFLCERGVEGATVLEIGGGVGEIQLELLRRGAARATNLEISTRYEADARRLLDAAGLTDRVTRRFWTSPSPRTTSSLPTSWSCTGSCAATPTTSGCSAPPPATPRACWSSATPGTTPSSGSWFGPRTSRAGCGGSRSVPSSTRQWRWSRCWSGTGLTTRDVHQGTAWRVVGLER